MAEQPTLFPYPITDPAAFARARANLRKAFPIPLGLPWDQYVTLLKLAYDNDNAPPVTTGGLPRGERGVEPVKVAEGGEAKP